MKLLLPPSETKRSGGAGAPLAIAGLAYPGLNRARKTLVRALVELAGNAPASAAALRLGPTQLDEVERNRRLLRSATMPVIDRFTGVLYDGLDAAVMTEPERDFAHEHVLVHSALFGLIAALDAIPAYRLSADSRLPDLRLRAHWAGAITAELARTPGLLVDLRSEAYVAFGPLPARSDAAYVRVLTEDASGRRRALNHFNKKAKGEFTRAIVRSGVELSSIDELIDWSRSSGWRLEPLPDAPGELALLV